LPRGHRRSSDAQPEPPFERGWIKHATPCVELIPGLANRRPGSGRTRLQGGRSGGCPNGSHREESPQDTTILDTERALPGGRSANRKPKETASPPPGPEPAEQGGSFELSRLVNQRPAGGEPHGTLGIPSYRTRPIQDITRRNARKRLRLPRPGITRRSGRAGPARGCE